MAVQKKISELIAKTSPLKHTDILVCSQLDGATYTSKKITGAQIFPYKVYSTILSQSSTSNPVVTGGFDQMGATYTWLRSSAGTYTLQTNQGNFFSGNVLLSILLAGTSNLGAYVRWEITSSSMITLYTYNSSNVLTDSIFNNASFELKIVNF